MNNSRITYKNNYYHVYNRGNNYNNIFFDDNNYHFFLRKLRDIFEHDIDVIAYVLMPNHYHLLIKLNADNCLAKAMQRLSTSYTKAINIYKSRVGHLFQGKYKFKIIEENNYLLNLTKYIHMNPVKAGLVKNPKDWKYSSYIEYITKQRKISKPEFILNQIDDYEKFMTSNLSSQNFDFYEKSKL